MNTVSRVALICFAGLVALLLASCGGGGGGGAGVDSSGGSGVPAGTTTFSGGTLSQLQALSPSLSFDHLEIAGGLKLPNYSSTTLKANSLTITPTGSIGYSYGSCDYFAAPSLTINTVGDVVIEGEILLGGRAGANVTSGATCKSCYGQDGGDVSITAGGNITAGGRIMNQGGYGASVTYVGMPSSSCTAGASGNLTMNAGGNFTINGSDIYNKAGKNGSGVYGTSGAASLTAGNLFSLSSGSVATTGALAFSAATTDIWGSITYGSLTESIGGSTDSTYPALTVLSPQPGATLVWNQPAPIQIQSSDTGMGLREVSVNGLGLSQVYSGSKFANGILTISSAVGNPMTLDIVATDNRGHQTNVSVAGLSVGYPQETEPNDSMAQAQMLNVGDIIKGDIMTGDAGAANAAIQASLQAAGDMSYTSRLGEDWFAVTISSTSNVIAVSLDFNSNLTAADIDMYLLDATGATVLASSTKDNIALNDPTESFISSLLSPGTYYVVLQAFNVPGRVNYSLHRTY